MWSSKVQSFGGPAHELPCTLTGNLLVLIPLDPLLLCWYRPDFRLIAAGPAVDLNGGVCALLQILQSLLLVVVI
jgi:hypothetical protein